MRSKIFYACPILAGLACWAVAQADPAGNQVGSNQTKLNDVAWLAGHWTGSFSNGTPADEHWSAPAGGCMMGMFRMMPNGKASLYEFLVIEENADGVALRFLHFGRNLRPMDQEPWYLNLTQAGPKNAVFVSPDADRPLRISYALESSDVLLVEVQSVKKGQPERFSVRFQRSHD